MLIHELIVVEPGQIEVTQTDLDDHLHPHEVLIETEYSIVSAGTEGAGFTGLVQQMPFGDAGQYPRGTGYGNLGQVLKVGDAVSGAQSGDRVLSFARHASIVKATLSAWPYPSRVRAPGQHLVFTRMAGVSISALRSSSVQPGDTVLVVGGGLVGNFAAQLFRLAGADVMLADLSELRLRQAHACGIERTVQSRPRRSARSRPRLDRRRGCPHRRRGPLASAKSSPRPRCALPATASSSCSAAHAPRPIST